MAVMKCPRCGNNTSDSARFCSSCGSPIGRAGDAASKGMPVWAGCLIAVGVTFAIVAFLGIMAAIAIPSFMKARNNARANVCMNNLRMIDAAKAQWAVDNEKSDGSQVDVAGVNRYIRGSTTPICPLGGTYTYGDVGVKPTCSMPEHRVPYW